MIALGEGAGENYPVWSLRKQNRLNAVISLRAMPGRLSGPFSNEHPTKMKEATGDFTLLH